MNHEKCATNEVFVGNVSGTQLPSKFSHISSARLGTEALDIHGKSIDRDQMRPMFINRADSDAYDRVMWNQ